MRCCDCEFRNRCDETEKVLTSFVKCYKRDRLLKEQKTQTNADKIRSMTDEELAVFWVFFKVWLYLAVVASNASNSL